MCGIVGYIGKQEAMPILLDCLKRLEYRGYDSAGLGIIEEGSLKVCRRAGKNAELASLLRGAPIRGTVGIAHTRWATHGRPEEVNAHPHVDCSRSLAIVHNGIVENHARIRKMLESDGHSFASQTDSEVIAHLLERALKDGDKDVESAIKKIITSLEGDYAIGVLDQRTPDRIIAIRNGGPPLVIGYSDDGLFVSSDIPTILQYTTDIRPLENGEMAVVSQNDARIINVRDGSAVKRASTRIAWKATAAEKGEYSHYMLKEIHEQPQAILDTIHGQGIRRSGEIVFPHAGMLEEEEVASINRVSLVACGTSWHAALVGKYMIELLCRIPVDVDIASEYRYRPYIPISRSLVIGLSQSGETADTVGAVKEAKNRKARVLSICNSQGSSIVRESDGVIYTHAGPEIGVAATKSFTCQVTALLLFAISFGQKKGVLTPADAKKLLDDLMEAPLLIEKILAREQEIFDIAAAFKDATNALYLGRDIHYPLAMEGSLKLKEISYIHAEGYPAGEMKHGPIALIDEHMPVIVIAPSGRLYGKILACIEEVKARNGIVIALASVGDTDIESRVDHVFYLPKTSELLVSLLAVVPLQLLAYRIAVERGCDVDKPRNLAKSVTVE